MKFKIGDRVVIDDKTIAASSLIGLYGTVVDNSEYFDFFAKDFENKEDFTAIRLDYDKSIRIFIHKCYRLLTPLEQLL